ncbi:helix-turn-helix transcriptional regulator [Cupriavidus basilensis]|uniref:helix-turn-helix transcriptional regulator n=1 Tax=Cupriavidus basilensis TaxID=68895 RepID=UPI0023E7E16E|nr:helix-turn-helix transcriptional regulator [Cupriavidus basilensis]MDF3886110.1 helix-turn-helix transcriptional regulator [Cupriavidus basilensis]
MRRDPDPLLAPDSSDSRPTGERNPYLTQLGERIRSLRAARGMSRKDLARGAEVSERYLANLETGTGNASVLLLRQVARALDVPLPVVLAEMETQHAPGDQPASEFSQLVQWLAQLPAGDLARVREACHHALAPSASHDMRHRRITLIGLRGAGKSTLGRALAAAMEVPFVELNGVIEQEAGASLAEIHSLYGQAAYRRYEMRALERVLREHDRMVLATPGSLVSEPSTFNLLLARCYTVWVKTSPEEHMARVVAQGDMRPMEGNREAMDDLRRILQARTPLYSRADATIDTSGQDPNTSLQALRAQLRALGT